LADGQALNSDDILLKKVDTVAVGGPDRWCGTIDQELVKSRPSVLRETFASSEIWKVHVCPIGAGQATWIAANIGVFARQPAFPHPAVALCVLTTNVVFTRASLLRTVCAVAAGVAKSDSMTKANTAIFSKMCRNFICCFRRNLVELKRGRDFTTEVVALQSGSDCKDGSHHFFCKRDQLSSTSIPQKQL
jgi:hypothetical protein